MEFENNLTAEMPESENIQEVAEPVNEGENVQEVAEPAENDDVEQAEGHEQVQSIEERRQNAAYRRRREQEAHQAELEAVQRAAQAKVDAAYAEMYKGQVNPYTGKMIQTEADYKAYMEQYRNEAAREQLNNAGLSPDVLNTFIENHPAIRRAETVLQQAEQARAQAQQELAKEGFAKEMKLISALDPEIQSADDLMNMPGVDQFNSLVRSGVSLSDAFKIVNFDKLVSKSNAAVKTSAINSAAGRNHLSATNVNGGSAKTIPPETLRMYREMNPGLSDAEYQKHYEKMNKE